MLNKIFKSGLIGVFALVIVVTVISCQKEKATIAVIIVKNNSGQVVPKAFVTLFPEPTISSQGNLPNPSLTNTERTDANGIARFTYDMEAILNIDVVKYEGNDTLVGTDIIRLLKGKSVTKAVEVTAN